MNKFIFILLVICFSAFSYSKTTRIPGEKNELNSLEGIKDGWYKATVEYTYSRQEPVKIGSTPAPYSGGEIPIFSGRGNLFPIDSYTSGGKAANAIYTLNVKVEYDRVVMIDFGNGGSVHTGSNREGYIYNGGYLSYEYDNDNNIVGAATKVSVSDSNGVKYFKIIIG